MPNKFLNSNFGPAELLRDEIAAFLAGCDDGPATVEEYRGAANSLAYLVVHPEAMADAAWFPGFYAKHPRFTLEFMVTMRRAMAAKSTGEKWLHSFDALARQREKDGAIIADVPMGSNELRTAREKLRAREALQQKQNLP